MAHRCRLGVLLAASALLSATPVLAQTATTIPGSVAAPEYDPNGTARFQPRRVRGVRAPVAPEPELPDRSNLLSPVANGAGTSGFDSSNPGRRRADRRLRARPQSPARELVPLGPVAVSGPIGRRSNTSGTDAFAAGRPGRPPVHLGPIYTVPKKRRAHGNDDPYAPLGIRSGGLVYYPAVEWIAGRDSNPGQVTNGTPAWLYTAAPELRVRSDWSRHELTADLRGSYTAYSPDTTPTLSRPYFNGRIDGRVDVTKNSRLDLGTRALVSTDNPGSPNLNAGLSKLPIYTTYGATAGAAHRFNRLELAIKGDVERTMFQDSKLTDGTTASNETRNYNQYGGTLRASYQYLPGVTPFIEGQADNRVHDINPDGSGFNRDSKGFTWSVGTTFELSRQLTGELAIGYTRRVYDDARLAALTGLIGNASLIWTASVLTTVKLAAMSSVGESTNAGVSGVLYRDVRLQVDHAFRQWLIGTAKIGLGFDDYVGSLREDKRYSAGLGLTYKLNRMVHISGEARRDWLRSSIGAVDYTANIFLLGLRLQY